VGGPALVLSFNEHYQLQPSDGCKCDKGGSKSLTYDMIYLTALRGLRLASVKDTGNPDVCYLVRGEAT